MDSLERPEGFPTVPEAGDGVVGEDMGDEAKSTIWEIVAMKFVSG